MPKSDLGATYQLPTCPLPKSNHNWLTREYYSGWVSIERDARRGKMEICEELE